jgi:putative chitinase
LNLSPHFTLAELTITGTGLRNVPTPAILANLRRTAEGLERVRATLGGKPIAVSSGYRAPPVNAKVGGSKTSDHVKGLASDFTCRAFGTPLEVCGALVEAELPFDQLIHEYGRWVHIGFGPRMRSQVMTIDRLGKRVGLKAAR